MDRPEGYRQRLRLHLIESEGYREKPYVDSKGIPTIGVGHNLRARPLEGEYLAYYRANNSLSRDLVLRLLDDDIAIAERDAERLFPDIWTYTEGRQVGLVDLLFNMGYATMLQFKPTIAHVRAQEWEDVAKHLEGSKWYKDVGRRGPKVVRLLRFG